MVWNWIKRRKKKRERIDKSEYQEFLSKVEGAVFSLYFETRDLSMIREEITTEVDKWLNSLSDLESESFKAGVCFGIYSLLKAIREDEKETKFYIT